MISTCTMQEEPERNQEISDVCKSFHQSQDDCSINVTEFSTVPEENASVDFEYVKSRISTVCLVDKSYSEDDSQGLYSFGVIAVLLCVFLLAAPLSILIIYGWDHHVIKFSW
ncbi:hypothetical protein J6590_011404 [Homalodisca vitripennis]|nr:hypothetical protein J6590_011404 [Homalodisca vitripennis]